MTYIRNSSNLFVHASVCISARNTPKTLTQSGRIVVWLGLFKSSLADSIVGYWLRARDAITGHVGLTVRQSILHYFFSIYGQSLPNCPCPKAWIAFVSIPCPPHVVYVAVYLAFWSKQEKGWENSFYFKIKRLERREQSTIHFLLTNFVIVVKRMIFDLLFLFSLL